MLQSSTGHIKNTVISNNGGFIPGIGNFTSLWPLVTHNFNEDIRITSSGSGPLRYIAGFFYQKGNTRGGQTVQLPDFVVAPGVTGFNTVNDRNQLFSEGWAVYGEATYSAFDRKLDLTVGGRYYKEKRRFEENSQLEKGLPQRRDFLGLDCRRIQCGAGRQSLQHLPARYAVEL